MMADQEELWRQAQKQLEVLGETLKQLNLANPSHLNPRLQVIAQKIYATIPDIAYFIAKEDDKKRRADEAELAAKIERLGHQI